MVEGVGPQAIAQGLTDEGAWADGIRDLHRTAEADGTFCYTFFKAVGSRQPGPASPAPPARPRQPGPASPAMMVGFGLV